MAALRETLLLPLDDLLAVTRELIFAAIDRATRWVYVEPPNQRLCHVSIGK